MTYTLFLLICTTVNGLPECHQQQQPGVYFSLQHCIMAAARADAEGRDFEAWKCRLNTGEEPV